MKGFPVEITVHADALYQHFLLTSEKLFWPLRPDLGGNLALIASNRPRRGSRRFGSST